MDIGVPRERRSHESRVGLTPAGVELLTTEGHNCYVESGAGVVTTRNHVRYVATEHGIADLSGKTLRSGRGP